MSYNNNNNKSRGSEKTGALSRHRKTEARVLSVFGESRTTDNCSRYITVATVATTVHDCKATSGNNVKLPTVCTVATVASLSDSVLCQTDALTRVQEILSYGTVQE